MLIRSAFLRLAGILGAAVLLLGCGRPVEAPCDAVTPLYSYQPFPIGVAVAADELQYTPEYRALTEGQFNSITPENIFKPSYLHPAAGQYAWAAADELADFCQRSGKRLHGHTLVWHEQLPGWLYRFQGDEAAWDALLKDHVQTICRHFRGRVRSWDVVNEAFNADGTLRNSLWKQHLGSSYLEKAFRYAHEADPDALLFYNDYDLESNPLKRRAVLGWLRDLRQRGVPVHGLGLQMHISVRHPENAQLAEALREVQQSGLLVHLSEIDVTLNPLSRPDLQPTPELLQRQADKLAFVVRCYRELPARQQHGLTFWGLTDAHSWLRRSRPDAPLLFDDSYYPKPAYCALTRF